MFHVHRGAVGLLNAPHGYLRRNSWRNGALKGRFRARNDVWMTLWNMVNRDMVFTVSLSSEFQLPSTVHFFSTVDCVDYAPARCDKLNVRGIYKFARMLCREVNGVSTLIAISPLVKLQRKRKCLLKYRMREKSTSVITSVFHYYYFFYSNSNSA